MANDKSVMTTVPGSVHAGLQKRADALGITLREYLRRVLTEDANFSSFYNDRNSLSMPDQVRAWLTHPEMILHKSPNEIFQYLVSNMEHDPDNNQSWSANIDLLVWMLVRLQASMLYRNVVSSSAITHNSLGGGLQSLIDIPASPLIDDPSSIFDYDKDSDEKLLLDSDRTLQDEMFKTAVSCLAEPSGDSDESCLAESSSDLDEALPALPALPAETVFWDVKDKAILPEDIKGRTLTMFGPTITDGDAPDEILHSNDHVWTGRQQLASIVYYYSRPLETPGMEFDLEDFSVSADYDWIRQFNRLTKKWIVFSMVAVSDKVYNQILDMYGKDTLVVDLQARANKLMLERVSQFVNKQLSDSDGFSETAWNRGLFMFADHKGKDNVNEIIAVDPELFSSRVKVAIDNKDDKSALDDLRKFYGIHVYGGYSDGVVIYDHDGVSMDKAQYKIDLRDPYNWLTLDEMYENTLDKNK